MGTHPGFLWRDSGSVGIRGTQKEMELCDIRVRARGTTASFPVSSLPPAWLAGRHHLSYVEISPKMAKYESALTGWTPFTPPLWKRWNPTSEILHHPTNIPSKTLSVTEPYEQLDCGSRLEDALCLLLSSSRDCTGSSIPWFIVLPLFHASKARTVSYQLWMWSQLGHRQWLSLVCTRSLPKESPETMYLVASFRPHRAPPNYLYKWNTQGCSHHVVRWIYSPPTEVNIFCEVSPHIATHELWSWLILMASH